jgi:Cu-processing system permease protein
MDAAQCGRVRRACARDRRVRAIRTGVPRGIEGTAAFGPASLALLRVTGDPYAAAAYIAISLVFGIAIPAWAAARRLARLDIA